MATIKAGTYRFNDVLNLDGLQNETGYELPFVVNPFLNIDEVNKTISIDDTNPFGFSMIYRMADALLYMNDADACFAYAFSDELTYGTHWCGAYFFFLEGGYSVPEGLLGWGQTITIPVDTEVSDEYGVWHNANTVRIEEETPIASIQYNGSTIASLFAGQKATLACEGMKMETDVVVEVGEVAAEPVLQEKTVTENGVVTPDDGYDGLSKVTVVVADNPLPIAIVTESEMNALLESANVGSVFKYTGETGDTYENGSLYILAEEGE